MRATKNSLSPVTSFNASSGVLLVVLLLCRIISVLRAASTSLSPTASYTTGRGGAPWIDRPGGHRPRGGATHQPLTICVVLCCAVLVILVRRLWTEVLATSSAPSRLHRVSVLRETTAASIALCAISLACCQRSCCYTCCSQRHSFFRYTYALRRCCFGCDCLNAQQDSGHVRLLASLCSGRLRGYQQTARGIRPV